MLPIEFLRQLGFGCWGNPVNMGLLYYPGAYTDTGALDLLVRSRSDTGHPPYRQFATAIYVDFNITSDEVEGLIQKIERRYSARVASVNNLSPSHFGKFTLADFSPQAGDDFFESVPEYSNHYQMENNDFFGISAFFPDIQLNFIYLKTEGIQTYRALQKAKIYPNLVVLQDHGEWGLQHASFYGESLLYKAAKQLPRFLYMASEGQAWPGFTKMTDSYCDEGQAHHYERYLCAR